MAAFVEAVEESSEKRSSLVRVGYVKVDRKLLRASPVTKVDVVGYVKADRIVTERPRYQG